MKFTILITILAFELTFLNESCYCQPQNQISVLELSEEYYESLPSLNIEIIQKIKSSIAEDTSIFSYSCFFDKVSNSIVYENTGNDFSILESGKKTYKIFPQSNEFLELDNGNSFVVQDLFKSIFINSNEFFKELKGKNLALRETDSSFILIENLNFYEFRKLDFSLIRMVESRYDYANKGLYYKECILSPSNTNSNLIADRIRRFKMLLETGTEVQEDNNNEKPVFFDRSLLKENARILNGTLENIDNKIIFIDAFYQSCYPCILAFQRINQFYEKKNSEIIIISVDHKPEDTLNMSRFLKRYNISHPVIIGEAAAKIIKALNIQAWPSFVIIEPSGKIIDYNSGYSPAFLNKVERRYFKSVKR